MVELEPTLQLQRDAAAAASKGLSGALTDSAAKAEADAAAAGRLGAVFMGVPINTGKVPGPRALAPSVPAAEPPARASYLPPRLRCD